jgi:hypothetical protein
MGLFWLSKSDQSLSNSDLGSGKGSVLIFEVFLPNCSKPWIGEEEAVGHSRLFDPPHKKSPPKRAPKV